MGRLFKSLEARMVKVDEISGWFASHNEPGPEKAEVQSKRRVAVGRRIHVVFGDNERNKEIPASEIGHEVVASFVVEFASVCFESIEGGFSKPGGAGKRGRGVGTESGVERD